MKTKLALLAFLATHFFTAAWAAEVVIPDTALKTAIWENLGRPAPVGIVTEQDMLGVTNLNAYFRGVTSLEGLGAAHNLTSLDLRGNELTSLILPAGLTSLTALDLTFNELTNLTVAAGLTNLVTLNLKFSTSSEFTLSGDVSHLTTLIAGDGDQVFAGPLVSLSLPPGLTSLTRLDLRKNRLTSLTLLDGLASLTTLELGYNQLTSLTFPAGLTSLATLNLYCNHLTDFSFLSGLTNLTTLDLGYNQLTALILPADLTSLITLILINNPLERFVLPEPLAVGALTELVADLRNQGVSVSIYLPTLRLVALPRTMGEAFEFLLTGPPGTYRLQVTEDFSTWTELDPVTLDANGSVNVTDSSANARPHSFYRAVRSN